MSRALLTTLALFGSLAPVPGWAGPGEEEAVAPVGRQRCPRLFGGTRSRKKAALRRERLLHLALEEPAGITVAHANLRWSGDPRRIGIEGVDLVSIDAEARPHTAVVELSEMVATRVGCVPGAYRMGADDAVGRRTRVLAVFREVVLVEHRGRLGYLAPPSAPSPRWLVAWSVPGATIHPSRAGKGRPPPPPRKPEPKKAPPPRARVKR